MTRIALVSDHASPLATLGGIDSGGQNLYVAHVAQQLGRLGFAVDVFTRRDNPLQRRTVEWLPNVRVVHVDAGPPCFVPKERLLAHMSEFGEGMLARAARRELRYDLVHANFFMSGVAGEHAAKAWRAPLVMTFHALGEVRRRCQGEADAFPVERLAIERGLLARADRTIAECPQDREDMLTYYGADPARISIVPCGYDPAELFPVDRRIARAELGWDAREFVVLQLGRIVPRKGIENVIRGMALLGQTAPELAARLVIVGGNSDEPSPEATPEIGRLAGIARELGIADRVRFLGRRRRHALRAIYSAADVFVTTPWYEPFGITPLEAMACGTPVIGSAVGGIKHTIEDGESGLLVPPEDPAALAAAIAKLAREPVRRAALARQGLRRVHAYTWNGVAEAIVDVYSGALDRGMPRKAAAGES
jgi:hypothetical protein